MTKQELREYRSLDRRIDNLLDEYAKWRSRAEKVTPIYTVVPAGGGNGNSTQKAVENIIELQDKIIADIISVAEKWNKIRNSINKLENNQYRELLTLYYIKGLTWEEVAEKMNMDARWIRTLHGKALQEMNKL